MPNTRTKLSQKGRPTATTRPQPRNADSITDVALCEVEDLGRLVAENEAERDEPVDGTAGDALHDQLGQLRHRIIRLS